MIRTLILSATLILAGGAASAQSIMRQDGGLGFANPCRPPLKFAAGACVDRCPAGYADVGAFCRLRNQGDGGDR